jgi:hypothetical protein
MHPPAAPDAVEHEGDEHVLGGVLRPQEVGVHLPGCRHDHRVGVVVAGLGYEVGALLAELRQIAGRPQEHREFVVAWHGRSVAPETTIP